MCGHDLLHLPLKLRESFHHISFDQSGRMHFLLICSKIYSESTVCSSVSCWFLPDSVKTSFQTYLGRDLTYQTAEVQISSVCPSRRVRYQAWRCMEWSFSSEALGGYNGYSSCKPSHGWKHVSKIHENTWKCVENMCRKCSKLGWFRTVFFGHTYYYQ